MICQVTMFHRAIMENDLEILKLLLAEERVNLDMLTSHGQLALSLTGQMSTMELLLRSESLDPNKIDIMGHSALHMMEIVRGIDIVSCMVQSQRFDPNMLGRRGYSAFHAAVQMERLGMMSCMLQSDRVDPKMLSSTGDHALKLTK
jgi:ankyrin repeat protein